MLQQCCGVILWQGTEKALCLPDDIFLVHPAQVGKVFHMNVLGKGPDRLKLPPELQQHVTVHRRLPYKGFYTIICHTLVGHCNMLCNPLMQRRGRVHDGGSP